MGSLFRSEKITSCQLIIQSDAVYSCVAELGELGLVQFKDLNVHVNNFNKKFVNEVRKCDEIEVKVCTLAEEAIKNGFSIPPLDNHIGTPSPKEILEIEVNLRKLENDLKELTKNDNKMKMAYLEHVEMRQVLLNAQIFFAEPGSSTSVDGSNMNEHLIEQQSQTPFPLGNNIGYMTGVIERERVFGFEKMLWRLCRGNVFVRQREMDPDTKDPTTGKSLLKTVFVVFYQGEELKQRIVKVCEGYHAHLYPCPASLEERRRMLDTVHNAIVDLEVIVTRTEEHINRILNSATKDLNGWLVKTRKAKAIYHTMNMFHLDTTKNYLVAECWVPERDIELINAAIQLGRERSGIAVEAIIQCVDTDQAKPTFYKTNKYTKAFQALIDAYGIATYREVNPTPFAIITFPFLFAIMFGDAGHGTVLTVFAAWMIIKEKSLLRKDYNNEIWKMLFAGRFIILLMGLFSIYNGIIYNDIFGKSINLFGSSWKVGNISGVLHSRKQVQLNPNGSQYDQVPYPLGMDPVWQLAQNKIVFLNSYKMKIAVIFGFCQMLLGIILSACNHRYFHRPLNMFCEFIPQIIFMFCIFGYLVFMIFYKWIMYSATNKDIAYNTNCAPALLLLFIDMFMFKQSDFSSSKCRSMFPNQYQVQVVLVCVGVICIPWMLLIKPFILFSRRNKSHVKFGVTSGEPETAHYDTKVVDNQTDYQPEDQTKQIREESLQEGLNGDIRTNEDDMKITEDLNGAVSQLSEQTPVTYGKNRRMSRKATVVVEVDPPDTRPRFDATETFVHQAIKTIEFFLGSVSHTASYLRLWALSLAHAELSEVLWHMVLQVGLKTKGWKGVPVLYLTFAAWAVLTMCVLVMMEGLSAFLHTIRLHWVEFQSKFYEGEGYPFVPFSFTIILSEAKERGCKKY